ncbi:MAG: aldo/keto reductase [Sporichthyaceae bacterium]|nr:aldo/keto reductase [Sporichthyaceae bacterium]
MQQRRIGSGGIEVGAIGLGCMPMSHGYGLAEQDDEESIRAVHRAIDLGVTLLDTADIYAFGRNEELVGRALHGAGNGSGSAARRDEVVLATKLGLVPGEGWYRYRNNGRPEYVKQACELSLQRLQTDRIDLYQLHRVDPEVPIEETWGAMAELVSASKVRALGLSEVGVAELERAQAVFPVSSVQSELSLWTRDPLAEVLPWCQAHGVGFLAFSPLGRGFLTGMVEVARLGRDDFRAANPRFTAQAAERNAALLGPIRAVAERRSATMAQIALAWLLAQGPQVVPIPGTKRTKYVTENSAATELVLTTEDMAELDALPPAAGSRY